MGDAADDLEHQEIQSQLYPFGLDIMVSDPVRDRNRKIVGDLKWTTKSGDRILLKDMDISHLCKVVNKIRLTGEAVVENNNVRDAIMDYYKYRATLHAQRSDR